MQTSHLARTALAEVRELYSWQAVGRRIQQVYGQLTGTGPDTGWTAAEEFFVELCTDN